MLINKSKKHEKSLLTTPDPRKDRNCNAMRLPKEIWRTTSNQNVIANHNTFIGYYDGHQCNLTTGITDIGVDELVMDVPHWVVRVYQDGIIYHLVSKEGSVYIEKGGYVAELEASDNAVIHIWGHVGKLTVNGSAQVMCYDGCYIDNAMVNTDGYMQIREKAAVHFLTVQKGGKCIVEEGAVITGKLLSDNAVFAQCLKEFNGIPKLRVRIRFDSEEHAVNYCKEATLMYKNRGCLEYGSLRIDQVHHCRCYDEYEDLERGHDMVEFLADSFTGVGRDEIACNITTCLASTVKAVDVWVDGQTPQSMGVSKAAKAVSDLAAEKEFYKVHENETLKAFLNRCADGILNQEELINRWKESRRECLYVDFRKEADWDCPPIGAPVHDEEAWDEYYSKLHQAQKKAREQAEKETEKELKRIGLS